MTLVLYRIYDADDQLLYVGASSNFPRRIQDHEKTQDWWDDAAYIKLERVDTWENLLQMEETSIVVERPLHNVLHGRKKDRSIERRRPKGAGALYRRKDGLWVGRVELPKGEDGKRKYKYVSSMDRLKVTRELDYLQAEADQDRREKEDRERCGFIHPTLGRCAYKVGHRLNFHLCGGQRIDASQQG